MHTNRKSLLLATIAFFALPIFSPLFAEAENCGKIEFYCTANGDAHAIIKGKKRKMNCAASTASKKGTIEPTHSCVGVLSSGKPTCLKGKPCKNMDGAKKMHMTACGTGTQEAAGTMSTQGCLAFGKQDFDDLNSCVGSPYEVHANARKNGR